MVHRLRTFHERLERTSPEILIIANSTGLPGLDWRLGDCDVFSTEGNNDGYDPYWSRWPTGGSGHYPKQIPNETWRFPFKHDKWGDYVTPWEEWARVAVSLICEGYLVNLDHSLGQGRDKLHDKLGEWLGPRLVALQGTRPGPLQDLSWGYTVVRDKTLYAHILRNRRGKAGLQGATELVLEPFDAQVQTVRLIPTGRKLTFTRNPSNVRISLSGVALDVIDTIIAVESE